jgi:hypothetical protein
MRLAESLIVISVTFAWALAGAAGAPAVGAAGAGPGAWENTSDTKHKTMMAFISYFVYYYCSLLFELGFWGFGVLVFNLGLVFFFALGLRFLFPEHVIDYGRVLLLMMVLASVSPLLSYFWYSSWALEFMFGCAFLLYLFKWLNPGLFFVFLFFFGVKAVKRMTVGAFYRVTYIKINQGHPSTLRQTLMASYPLMQIRILGGKVMELRYPKAVHKDVTEKVFVETLGKVDVLDQNPFGDQALLLHSSQFKKTKINILGSLTSLKLFQNPDDLKLLRRKLQKYKSTQRAQVLMLRHQRYSLGRSGRKGFLGLMRL